MQILANKNDYFVFSEGCGKTSLAKSPWIFFSRTRLSGTEKKKFEVLGWRITKTDIQKTVAGKFGQNDGYLRAKSKK